MLHAYILHVRYEIRYIFSLKFRINILIKKEKKNKRLQYRKEGY